MRKVNSKEVIMLLETDLVLNKIIRYFGENTDALAEILSSYTRIFGEKHEIISLLKDENVQQYVKSELGKEQSVDEFSKLVSKLGPQIIEEIQNDITIKDHSLNRWLKHIIDDEIS